MTVPVFLRRRFHGVRLTVAIPVVVALLLFSGSAGVAGARRYRVGCRSGATSLREHGVRVFWTWQSPPKRHEPEPNRAWHLCSRSLRKPVTVDAEGGFGISLDERRFALLGNLLGFAFLWDNGTAAGWELGSIDVRTGERRLITFEDFESGVPTPTQIVEFAFDSAGHAAFVDNDTNDHVYRVAYAEFASRRHRARWHYVTSVPAGSIRPGSLSLSQGTISWTATDGTAQSAPAG